MFVCTVCSFQHTASNCLSVRHNNNFESKHPHLQHCQHPNLLSYNTTHHITTQHTTTTTTTTTKVTKQSSMPPSNALATTTRRLLRELTVYKSDPNPALTYLYPPDESNLLHWRAGLRGVVDSPYEGGVWTIDVTIPENYPTVPPVVTFVTKICHPNIHFKVRLFSVY